MSGEAHKAAVIGGGLLTVGAAGVKLCDDAARVGRLGSEVATVGRIGDDVIRAADSLPSAARLLDDAVVAGRMAAMGEVVEEGGTASWRISRRDAVELTVDIGIEVLSAVEWDTGEVPLTPPLAALSGMWAAEGHPPTVPDAWMCATPPAEGHRECAFVYSDGGELVLTEGLLIVRDGVICRAVLQAPALGGLSPTQTLSALNARPCERLLASDGASLALDGPGGAYVIRMAAE